MIKLPYTAKRLRGNLSYLAAEWEMVNRSKTSATASLYTYVSDQQGHDLQEGFAIE